MLKNSPSCTRPPQKSRCDAGLARELEVAERIEGLELVEVGRHVDEAVGARLDEARLHQLGVQAHLDERL